MRKVLYLLFFLISVLSVTSQSIIEKTDDLIEPAIDLYLENKIDKSFQKMNELDIEIINLDELNWKNDYRLLRLDLWRSRVYMSDNNERAGERLLFDLIERSGRFTDISKKINLGNRLIAEGYRIEAEARADLMLYKGLRSIIQNASAVQELSEKACDLDELNIDAQLLKAQGKINAPPIFGGNRNEGISILMELWNSRGIQKRSRVFKIAVSLGDAYSKEDPEKARNFYKQAESLYPGNSIVKKRIEEL